MSSFPFSHCLQTGVLAKRTLPSSPSISKHFLSLPPSLLPPGFISHFREGSDPLHPEYALGGPQGPGSGWVLQLSPPRSREGLPAVCCTQWLFRSGHPVCEMVKSSFFCFSGRLVWMEKTLETAPSASASSWCSGLKGSSSMSPRWT